jgi:hypothetical protein
MKRIFIIALFGFMLFGYTSVRAEDIYEPKPSRFVQKSFIVLPGTEIYVAPEIAEYDLYFFQDWFWQKHGLDWWRTRGWNNRWTRYYLIPKFVREVPRDWRQRYMSRSWDGKPWKPKLIPYSGLEQYQRTLHQQRMHRKKVTR